jgi:trimethylamine--corrinoid protein Co-methyltransferase
MSQLLLNVLGAEDVDQIIGEGMQLLMDPGVRIHNDQALELLIGAGAEVDRAKQVAFIPEYLVQTALKTVPREFYLYSLDGEPVVHYGGERVQFDPGSAAIAVLDSHTGKHRPPVTGDFVNFVKIVEMLPQIDAQSTSMVCADVPEEIGDLYRLYLALLYMRKPIVTGAFRKDTWWTMKEMLVAIAGDELSLSKHPIAIFDVCPSPPLLWSDLTCQNLIDCAVSGIPAQLVAMPLAGAAAPVTLAAAVVQHTAENFSGLVIHQLAKAGSPLVWGGSPAAFDMRRGTTPMGAPETWLIDAAYVQVGRRLFLPTHVYMGMSDAKIIDAQCGLESMAGTMMAALMGANMVSGAGMLDFETCQSLEKLVIDAEMISLARRVIAGIVKRDEPIALDLIRSMGHRGDYLASPHTRKWYREEFYMPSKVIDRGSLEAWHQEGSKSTFDRAHERAKSLMNAYEGPRLPKEKSNELKNITQTAALRFGIRELPPIPE